MWIRRQCRNVVVKGATFQDISGNALMLGDVADHGLEGTSSKISVQRCLVHYCGRQFFGSVGIWAGIARELEITHNDVTNMPYSGISLGWRWNDKPSSAGKNRVTHNKIVDVMQVLSDGGGIYTLGRQTESFLHENHIHGIPTNAGRADSNGIFMDQGSSGFTVADNLIYDVAKPPLRFHH